MCSGPVRASESPWAFTGIVGKEHSPLFDQGYTWKQVCSNSQAVILIPFGSWYKSLPSRSQRRSVGWCSNDKRKCQPRCTDPIISLDFSPARAKTSSFAYITMGFLSLDTEPIQTAHFWLELYLKNVRKNTLKWISQITNNIEHNH